MQHGNWFVALVVPEQAGLDGVLPSLPPGLRRFQPGDRHLSVAFLGACGAERALDAWQAIAACSHPPIAVRHASWRAMGRPLRGWRR